MVPLTGSGEITADIVPLIVYKKGTESHPTSPPLALPLPKGQSPMKRLLLCALSFLAGPLAGTGRAAEPTPIAPEQFEQLHKMIRVQPDEQRFWQIPWKLTISEARAQAAKEGKPIFVWAGAGGAPIGVC